MAKTVLILRRETGMTESEILSLPARRINTYIKEIKELYK